MAEAVSLDQRFKLVRPHLKILLNLQVRIQVVTWKIR